MLSCQETVKPTSPEYSIESVGSTKATLNAIDTDSETLEAPRFSFLFYNLKNYLSLPVYSKGEFLRERFKPTEELSALYTVLSRSQPDLLGVCEIGTENDLQRLQTDLRTHGVDYPYATYCPAPDSERHLALLSKHPISSEDHSTDQRYWIGKHQFPIQRGILDCTVTINDQDIRLIGAHLKSKRTIDEASETEMRAQEAVLIKAYLDGIIESNPDAPLLFFGDLNDTVKSRTLGILKGKHRINSPLHLLTLEDSTGNNWTHEWDYQDVYSRIDYIFCSKSLKPFLNKESRIIDLPEVSTASDHRPLFVQFD